MGSSKKDGVAQENQAQGMFRNNFREIGPVGHEYVHHRGGGCSAGLNGGMGTGLSLMM